LEWEHIGETGLTVPLTKTGGYAIVPYDRMDRRLKETIDIMGRGRGAVFPARNPRWWNARIKAITKPLPVFGELRGGGVGNQWHLLRATWAVNCARRGATLWELMAWGGWTVPQTVMRYVNVARAAGA